MASGTPAPPASTSTPTPEQGALAKIIERAATLFPIDATLPMTWLSFALMRETVAFPVRVNVHLVAAMLNDVGRAAMTAGLLDLQFYLQNRNLKSRQGLDGVQGVIIDVDRPAPDPLVEIHRAGLPTPTFVFQTLNGYKFGLVTDQPFSDVRDAEELAQRCALAIAADPTSWNMGQAQRLPTCLKTTLEGVVHVEFDATTTNPVPIEASPLAVPMPHRLLDALGSGALSEAQRDVVRTYLAELGTPVPSGSGGSALYDRCPEQVHDTRCTYVSVAHDGSICVHCLGGHGAQTWRERDLHALALDADEGANKLLQGFDPLKHLPVTWATRSFVLSRVSDWAPAEQQAAVNLWRRHYARKETREGVTMQQVEIVQQRRLDGVRPVGAQHLYFDELTGELCVTDSAGARYLVSSPRGISKKAHAHALFSTAAHVAATRDDKRTGTATVVYDWMPEIDSIVTSLAAGNRDVLRVVGVPALAAHAYPVAFLNDEWRIAAKTMHLARTTCSVDLNDAAPVDPITFFMDTKKDGLIPLGTENDVLLFVAMIASPLLRHVCPGQIGIYWLLGPPGVGKEYLVAIANAIWTVLNPNGPASSFEITAAGDLELKRSMAGAKGAVYARVKEAGKRGPRFIDEVIRLSTTDRIPARSVGGQEAYLSNHFTFIADSAENVPDRREISRRTLVIRCSPADESKAKGDLLEMVRKNARGMVRWLQREIEALGSDYFLKVKDADSRPIIPVALARMLGAKLPPVEGEDLDELFEAMLDYVQSGEGINEGRDRLTKANGRAEKESIYSRTLPSHRFVHFVSMMKNDPGHRETIARYGDSGMSIAARIARETDYGTLTAVGRPYYAVDIGGARYAFRIEAANRRFILVREHMFTGAMHGARAAKSTGSTSIDASHTDAEVSPTQPAVTGIQ